MDVAKDQLHIFCLKVGKEEAHHPYSKNNYTYTADELFKHLVETAIPVYLTLKRKGKLPTMAPLKLPTPPNVPTLGTMSELGKDLYEQTENEQVKLRNEAQEERDRREERGEGDRWSEMQRVNAPEINNKLVQNNFKIEMRFSMPGDSGEKVLDWYHGTVTKIVNKNKRSVEITWDEECLHDDDLEKTTQVLLISRWNHKKSLAGTWRERLTT